MRKRKSRGRSQKTEKTCSEKGSAQKVGVLGQSGKKEWRLEKRPTMATLCFLARVGSRL